MATTVIMVMGTQCRRYVRKGGSDESPKYQKLRAMELVPRFLQESTDTACRRVDAAFRSWDTVWDCTGETGG